MDPDYSTSSFIVDDGGDITYDNPRMSLYELVDDNDDQDRSADWFRFSQGGGDVAVFPGWDENNDFVSDFNQNDNRILNNRIPDYEEPFFRYAADRPEFLFGIDLNNNGWIDRFENDDLPDYPYKVDRRGYNLYAGVFLDPHTRLTLGRLSEESMASDGRNRAAYGLLTYDRDFTWGRLRAFEMLRRVEDDIADDRREMTPHLEVNSLALVRDILPARDTWINTTYLQLDYQPLDNLNANNKFKYERFWQQGSAFKSRVKGPILNQGSHLFGLINKADYTFGLAGFKLQPKVKSEYLNQTALEARAEDREEWVGTGIVLLSHPLLSQSLVEGALNFPCSETWLSTRARSSPTARPGLRVTSATWCWPCNGPAPAPIWATGSRRSLALVTRACGRSG